MRRADPWRPPSSSRDRRAAGPGPGGSEAGFTLIEVLAALAVTAAFIAVVLPYAGRLATRWWVGEAIVEQADAWMQAVGRMEDDLGQALPYGIGAAEPQPAFSAGSDTIVFVRPALGGGSGLESVTYEIRPSPAGSALVRRSRRFDPDTFGRDVGGSAATLLDGPFRFRLVEIGQDGTRRRGWTPADGMPAGVELSAVATGAVAVPAAPVEMPIAARALAAARPDAGATR